MYTLEPLSVPLTCPRDPVGHNTHGPGPDGVAHCDYCGAAMYREWPARQMVLRIHFLHPGTLAEEVQFGDELQQGRDWRWRGEELIVRRNDGNRCEYPARNIRCVEIDKGGAS